MSTTRLTEQQRQSLEVRGASVALSAGAGCGKTTVLTERFIAALGDEAISLDRIVALTFTDKAATELRGRVRSACRKKLDAGDDPEYWRGIMRGLEAAPIGTFHTFCGEVVRRYAAQAGVDQGFSILDETIASTCREEAVDVTLRASLRLRDNDLHELAVAYGLNRVRESLIALMSSRSAPDFIEWAAKSPEDLIAIWKEVFETKVKRLVIAEVVAEGGVSERLIRSNRESFPPAAYAKLSLLLDLLPSINPSSTDLLATLAVIKELASMPRSPAKNKWPDLYLYNATLNTLAIFRKCIDQAVNKLDPEGTDTLLSADHGIRFARLADRAWQSYESVKHTRGALDFNDLLLKMLDLLRDDAATVVAELTARFDLILVDEFQDTDPVQDEIVRRIAGDDLAGGRLFLVGDFKQSIYGFREARPELFAKYRLEFPSRGQRSLTENFRSRPPILSFVNALFADAFDHIYEPLVAGRPEVLPEEQSSVVFTWPARHDDSEGKDGRPVDVRRQDEAMRLAGLVRRWIDEGRLVRDKETNQPRAMHAGDVAFLVRAKALFAPIERALDSVGVDYHVIGGAAFYAQQEIQDIINVLAFIDDPHDPLALAGALRSPFFALSDEALFWLSTGPDRSLVSGLARYDEASFPELSPRDRANALRAREGLARWRSFKDRESIAALVARVLEESGFEAALLGEPLGDRKRANARKMVRMARKFDNEGGFTLADYVARLRADRNDPPNEDEASTTEELGEAVHLLTIHKAKGLEFPVVILADLDRKSSSRSDLVVFDPVLGPLINAKDEDDPSHRNPKGTRSLGRLVHDQIRKEEDRAESIRIFYVAATRARDLLVLSVCGDPFAKAKAESEALKLLQARFDLSTGTCLADVPAVPGVEVIDGQPRGALETIRKRRRPPVLALSRLIERSLPSEDTGPSPIVPSASALRRLNLDPSRSLSPSVARLDRLVRSILLDPRSYRPNSLDDVAHELARRQFPAASARIEAEAIARVRHWIEGPLGREIGGAVEVAREVSWSVRWPEGSSEAIAIEGRIDLAYRAAKGGWRLLQVADVSAADLPERLRLNLSARLAEGLGCGPVVQAWRVRHGPDGGLQSEEEFTEVKTIALLESITRSATTPI